MSQTRMYLSPIPHLRALGIICYVNRSSVRFILPGVTMLIAISKKFTAGFRTIRCFSAMCGKILRRFLHIGFLFRTKKTGAPIDTQKRRKFLTRDLLQSNRIALPIALIAFSRFGEFCGRCFIQFTDDFSGLADDQ
jgi:hypothetical protein